jgi:hypothetical protein
VRTLLVTIVLLFGSVQGQITFITGFEQPYETSWATFNGCKLNSNSARTGALGWACKTDGSSTAAQVAYRFNGANGAGDYRHMFKSWRVYGRLEEMPHGSFDFQLGQTFMELTNESENSGRFEYVTINQFGQLGIGNVSGYPSPGFYGSFSGWSSKTLSVDGLFHLFQVECGYNNGVGRRLYVDGELWATDPDTDCPAQPTLLLGASLRQSTGISAWSFDDLIASDQSVVLPPGRSVLLPVVQDASLGGWKLLNGSTTDVFTALTPLGTQMKHTGNGNYEGFTVSYFEAGVPVGATINGVMAIDRDAESSTRRTKKGSLSLVSNPTTAEEGFVFGDDYGLALFFYAHTGKVGVNPTVDYFQRPVVKLTHIYDKAVKDNEVQVDSLAVYVDFQ